MTSFRQFEANRQNCLRSTGPRTAQGKRRSRLNAIRHGLTAETVVPDLEDSEDYRAFEATIIADYCAETAVARELVLRLASLLWRLRRAAAIETDLFARKSAITNEYEAGEAAGSNSASGQVTIRRLASSQFELGQIEMNDDTSFRAGGFPDAKLGAGRRTRALSSAFLRLAELDSAAFERLNRYELALWRQAVQIIWTLKPIRVRRAG